MAKHNEILGVRTDKELIRDWVTLDTTCQSNGRVTVEQATIRGWLMDEIKRRFPKEFDAWIENSHIDDNLEHYIRL